MDVTWFEMRERRRRRLDSQAWVPLRAAEQRKEGKLGMLDYESEFFGAASIAVPLAQRAAAEQLNWGHLGLNQEHRPRVEDGSYHPADEYRDDHRGLTAQALVLVQRGNSQEREEWHLHQDLALGLRLLREGDRWLAMDEGYGEVVRLMRDPDGSPWRLEIRTQHLKDYLCARDMALYVSHYAERVRVVPSDVVVPWTDGRAEEEVGMQRWEGRAYDIVEGSWTPFGASVATFHASRTDVDLGDDVPDVMMRADAEYRTSENRFTRTGTRLQRVDAGLWMREWVEPGPSSPIVREDRIASTVQFIVAADGTQREARQLTDAAQWLWFRPDLIPALLRFRHAALEWYSRDTGGIRCLPMSPVHFGLNDVGLVVVFAKDIATLPEWQQRIWAGFNVVPDGGIGAELHASQVRADPAETVAPEAVLAEALACLARTSVSRLGVSLLRQHGDIPSILTRINRFRVLTDGVFALAKDIARVLVDAVDTKVLQARVAPPKGQQWGSLKSLEHVIAVSLGAAEAHRTMGPLFGVYDLRLADAHLPKADLDHALRLAGVSADAPTVQQGRELLETVVATIHRVTDALPAPEGGSSEAPLMPPVPR